MKKLIMCVAASMFIWPACSQNQTKQKSTIMSEQNLSKSIYDYEVETIDGKKIKMSQFKGKRLLIVNTASECGLTPQYKNLQELYTQYGGEKFEIIGFPANNFGAQEPGSNEQIQGFCEKNYGVSFSMMAKVSVKGSDKAPIYQWLTLKALNGKQDVDIPWNFGKFLIDENGNWVKFVSPQTNPLDEEILGFLR
jgi:glutathione peroxidase